VKLSPFFRNPTKFPCRMVPWHFLLFHAINAPCASRVIWYSWEHDDGRMNNPCTNSPLSAGTHVDPRVKNNRPTARQEISAVTKCRGSKSRSDVCLWETRPTARLLIHCSARFPNGIDMQLQTGICGHPICHECTPIIAGKYLKTLNRPFSPMARIVKK